MPASVRGGGSRGRGGRAGGGRGGWVTRQVAVRPAGGPVSGVDRPGVDRPGVDRPGVEVVDVDAGGSVGVVGGGGGRRRSGDVGGGEGRVWKRRRVEGGEGVLVGGGSGGLGVVPVVGERVVGGSFAGWWRESVEALDPGSGRVEVWYGYMSPDGSMFVAVDPGTESVVARFRPGGEGGWVPVGVGEALPDRYRSWSRQSVVVPGVDGRERVVEGLLHPRGGEFVELHPVEGVVVGHWHRLGPGFPWLRSERPPSAGGVPDPSSGRGQSVGSAVVAAVGRLTGSGGRFAGWEATQIADVPLASGGRDVESVVLALVSPDGRRAVSLDPRSGVVTGEFSRPSRGHGWYRPYGGDGVVLVEGQRYEGLVAEGLPPGVGGALRVVVGSDESGFVVRGTPVDAAGLAELLRGPGIGYRSGQAVDLVVDGPRLDDAVVNDLAQRLSASVTQQTVVGWGKRPAVEGGSSGAGPVVESDEFAGWSPGRIEDSPLVIGRGDPNLSVPGLISPDGLRAVSVHPDTGEVTGRWWRESDRHPWRVRVLGGASSASDVDTQGRTETGEGSGSALAAHLAGTDESPEWVLPGPTPPAQPGEAPGGNWVPRHENPAIALELLRTAVSRLRSGLERIEHAIDNENENVIPRGFRHGYLVTRFREVLERVQELDRTLARPDVVHPDELPTHREAAQSLFARAEKALKNLSDRKVRVPHLRDLLASSRSGDTGTNLQDTASAEPLSPQDQAVPPLGWTVASSSGETQSFVPPADDESSRAGAFVESDGDSSLSEQLPPPGEEPLRPEGALTQMRAGVAPERRVGADTWYSVAAGGTRGIGRVEFSGDGRLRYREPGNDGITLRTRDAGEWRRSGDVFVDQTIRLAFEPDTGVVRQATADELSAAQGPAAAISADLTGIYIWIRGQDGWSLDYRRHEMRPSQGLFTGPGPHDGPLTRTQQAMVVLAKHNAMARAATLPADRAVNLLENIEAAAREQLRLASAKQSAMHDKPRIPPPWFGGVDRHADATAGGAPRSYSLGHHGRVIIRPADGAPESDAFAIPDITPDSREQLGQLVVDALPDNHELFRGDEFRDSVKRAVRDYLGKYDGRIFLEMALAEGAPLKVAVPGRRDRTWEIRVKLQPGDPMRAEYVPLADAERVPPGREWHVAVNADHEVQKFNKASVSNTRGIRVDAAFPDLAPGADVDARLRAQLGATAFRTFAHGTDTVSATKRYLDVTGLSAYFDYGDARIVTEVREIVRRRRFLRRSRPVVSEDVAIGTTRRVMRFELPLEQSPERPDGVHGVVPDTPLKLDPSVEPVGVDIAQYREALADQADEPAIEAGDIPLRSRTRQQAAAMSRALGYVLTLPEAATGLERLREKVLTRLRSAPERTGWLERLRAKVRGWLTRGSERLSVEAVQDASWWLSEAAFLRMYQDIIGTGPIGSISPPFANGNRFFQLPLAATLLRAEAVDIADMPIKEEIQRFQVAHNSTSEGGGLRAAVEGGAEGIVRDGDNQPRLKLGGGGSVTLVDSNASRSVDAVQGSGDIRGLVYVGDSVRYRLTMHARVRIETDMKGVDTSPVDDIIEVYVRIPIQQRARFEELLRLALAEPTTDPMTRWADLPKDRDPEPADPRQADEMWLAEQEVRYPPVTLAAKQSMGKGAMERLAGGEAVLEELLRLEAAADRQVFDLPRRNKREELLHQRMLSASATREALLNHGIAVDSPTGHTWTDEQPGWRGTVYRRYVVRAERDDDPIGSGRIASAKIETMPAGFKNFTSGMGVGSSVSFGGRFALSASHASGWSVGPSFRFGGSVGRSESMSVGATGFQIQAVLYKGPARYFDYAATLHLSVQTEYRRNALGWLVFAAKWIWNLVTGSGPARAVTTGEPSRHTLTGASIRHVVPEYLTSPIPAGRPTRERTGAVTERTDGPGQTIEEQSAESLPPASAATDVTTAVDIVPSGHEPVPNDTLPADWQDEPAAPPRGRGFRPISNDDAVQDVLGGDHLRRHIVNVLNALDQRPTGRRLTWRALSELLFWRRRLTPLMTQELADRVTDISQLVGIHVAGNTPMSAMTTARGLFSDTHYEVLLVSRPYNPTPAGPPAEIMKMDVAEGGQTVGHGKGRSWSLALGFSFFKAVLSGRMRPLDVGIGGSRGRRKGEVRGLGPSMGRLSQITRLYEPTVSNASWAVIVRRRQKAFGISFFERQDYRYFDIRDGVSYLRTLHSGPSGGPKAHDPAHRLVRDINELPPLVLPESTGQDRQGPNRGLVARSGQDFGPEQLAELPLIDPKKRIRRWRSAQLTEPTHLDSIGAAAETEPVEAERAKPESTTREEKRTGRRGHDARERRPLSIINTVTGTNRAWKEGLGPLAKDDSDTEEDASDVLSTTVEPSEPGKESEDFPLSLDQPPIGAPIDRLSFLVEQPESGQLVVTDDNALVEAVTRALPRRFRKRGWSLVQKPTNPVPNPTNEPDGPGERLGVLLNPGSLTALGYSLPTGIKIVATRSRFGIHETAVVTLQLHRDGDILREAREKHGLSARFELSEVLSRVNEAIYSFRNNVTARAAERSTNVDYGYSPGGTIPLPAESVPGVSPGMGLPGSHRVFQEEAFVRIDGARDTHFITGTAARYSAVSELRVSTVVTREPSRLLTAVPFVRSLMNRLWPAKAQEPISQLLLERTIVPYDLTLPSVAQAAPGVTRTTTDTTMEAASAPDVVEVVPGSELPAGKEFPVNTQQILAREVTAFGVNPSVAAELQRLLMDRLRGTVDASPAESARGQAGRWSVRRLTSHVLRRVFRPGQRAGDALAALFSVPMLLRELEFFVANDGLQATFVADDGAGRDKRARVTVKIRLFNPKMLNWLNMWTEFTTPQFTEHKEGKGASDSAGGDFPFGVPAGPISVGPTVSFRSTASKTGAGVLKSQFPTTGFLTAIAQLRTSLDARVTVEIEGEYAPWLLGVPLRRPFRFEADARALFVVLLDPYHAITRGLVHPLGVPHGSGYGFVSERVFDERGDESAEAVRRRADEIAAWTSFPVVEGVKVIHIKTRLMQDGTLRFEFAKKVLTADEFERDVLRPLLLNAQGEPRFQMVALVASYAGRPGPKGEEPVAQQFARRLGIQFVAAAGRVYTDPGGRVISGDLVEIEGLPVPRNTTPFILFRDKGRSETLHRDLAQSLSDIIGKPVVPSARPQLPPTQVVFWDAPPEQESESVPRPAAAGGSTETPPSAKTDVESSTPPAPTTSLVARPGIVLIRDHDIVLIHDPSTPVTDDDRAAALRIPRRRGELAVQTVGTVDAMSLLLAINQVLVDPAAAQYRAVRLPVDLATAHPDPNGPTLAKLIGSLHGRRVRGYLDPAEHQRIFEQEIRPELERRWMESGPRARSVGGEALGRELSDWRAGDRQSEGNKPVAMFIVGQTGAGKSGLVPKAIEDISSQYVHIDMDLFTGRHPAYGQAVVADPGRASDLVRDDTQRWWEAANEWVQASLRSVVIESAAASPEEFEALVEQYRRHGYRIDVRILATPVFASRIGTIERAIRAEEDNKPARWVPAEDHDRTFNGVLRSARFVDTHPDLIDEIRIYRREDDKFGSLLTIYSNGAVGGRWERPPAAARALHNERMFLKDIDLEIFGRDFGRWYQIAKHYNVIWGSFRADRDHHLAVNTPLPPDSSLSPDVVGTRSELRFAGRFPLEPSDADYLPVPAQVSAPGTPLPPLEPTIRTGLVAGALGQRWTDQYLGLLDKLTDDHNTERQLAIDEYRRMVNAVGYRLYTGTLPLDGQSRRSRNKHVYHVLTRSFPALVGHEPRPVGRAEAVRRIATRFVDHLHSELARYSEHGGDLPFVEVLRRHGVPTEEAYLRRLAERDGPWDARSSLVLADLVLTINNLSAIVVEVTRGYRIGAAGVPPTGHLWFDHNGVDSFVLYTGVDPAELPLAPPPLPAPNRALAARVFAFMGDLDHLVDVRVERALRDANAERSAALREARRQLRTARDEYDGLPTAEGLGRLLRLYGYLRSEIAAPPAELVKRLSDLNENEGTTYPIHDPVFLDDLHDALETSLESGVTVVLTPAQARRLAVSGTASTNQLPERMTSWHPGTDVTRVALVQAHIRPSIVRSASIDLVRLLLEGTNAKVRQRLAEVTDFRYDHALEPGPVKDGSRDSAAEDGALTLTLPGLTLGDVDRVRVNSGIDPAGPTGGSLTSWQARILVDEFRAANVPEVELGDELGDGEKLARQRVRELFGLPADPEPFLEDVAAAWSLDAHVRSEHTGFASRAELVQAAQDGGITRATEVETLQSFARALRFTDRLMTVNLAGAAYPTDSFTDALDLLDQVGRYLRDYGFAVRVAPQTAFEGAGVEGAVVLQPGDATIHLGPVDVATMATATIPAQEPGRSVAGAVVARLGVDTLRRSLDPAAGAWLAREGLIGALLLTDDAVFRWLLAKATDRRHDPEIDLGPPVDPGLPLAVQAPVLLAGVDRLTVHPGAHRYQSAVVLTEEQARALVERINERASASGGADGRVVAVLGHDVGAPGAARGIEESRAHRLYNVPPGSSRMAQVLRTAAWLDRLATNNRHYSFATDAELRALAADVGIAGPRALEDLFAVAWSVLPPDGFPPGVDERDALRVAARARDTTAVARETAQLSRVIERALRESSVASHAPSPQAGLLGPDRFGSRTAPPPPAPLAELNVDTLGTWTLHDFLRRLALNNPDPEVDVSAPLEPDPSTVVMVGRQLDGWMIDTSWLDDGPESFELPRSIHAVWLGSPITGGDGPAASVRATVLAVLSTIAVEAYWLRDSGRPWQVHLWTDIPRSAFQRADSEPDAHGSSWLRDVRAMRQWATDYNIVLLNVDELFHANAPMPLNEQYRAELARRSPLGYREASAILGAAIVERFGGVYIGQGSRLTGIRGLISAARDRAVAFDVRRVGLRGAQLIDIDPSTIVAARSHPIVRHYRRLIAANYRRTEQQLLNAPSFATRLEQEEALRSGAGPARVPERLRTWARGVDSAQLGIQYAADVPSLARVTGEGPATDAATNDPLAPMVRYSSADAPAVARDIVSTLERGLVDRDGDLHLTAVAPVVAALPNPDAAWRAVIRFLLTQPDVVERIRTITDRVLTVEADGRVTTHVVPLPAPVRAALGLIDPEPPADPEGVWRLGELMRPFRGAQLEHLTDDPADDAGVGTAPPSDGPASGPQILVSVFGDHDHTDRATLDALLTLAYRHLGGESGPSTARGAGYAIDRVAAELTLPVGITPGQRRWMLVDMFRRAQLTFGLSPDEIRVHDLRTVQALDELAAQGSGLRPATRRQLVELAERAGIAGEPEQALRRLFARAQWMVGQQVTIDDLSNVERARVRHLLQLGPEEDAPADGVALIERLDRLATPVTGRFASQQELLTLAAQIGIDVHRSDALALLLEHARWLGDDHPFTVAALAEVPQRRARELYGLPDDVVLSPDDRRAMAGLDQLATLQAATFASTDQVDALANTVGFRSAWDAAQARARLFHLARAGGGPVTVKGLQSQWVRQTYGLNGAGEAEVRVAALLDRLALPPNGDGFARPDQLRTTATDVGFGPPRWSDADALAELFELARAAAGPGQRTVLTVDRLRQWWVARVYRLWAVAPDQVEAARRLDRLVTNAENVFATPAELVAMAREVGFGDERGGAGWSERGALGQMLALASQGEETLTVTLLRQRWVGQTYGLQSLPDSAQVVAAARLDQMVTGRDGVFASRERLLEAAAEIGFRSPSWEAAPALAALLELAGSAPTVPLSVDVLQRNWVMRTYGLSRVDDGQLAAAAQLNLVLTRDGGVFARPDQLRDLARGVGIDPGTPQPLAQLLSRAAWLVQEGAAPLTDESLRSVPRDRAAVFSGRARAEVTEADVAVVAELDRVITGEGGIFATRPALLGLARRSGVGQGADGALRELFERARWLTEQRGPVTEPALRTVPQQRVGRLYGLEPDQVGPAQIEVAQWLDEAVTGRAGAYATEGQLLAFARRVGFGAAYSDRQALAEVHALATVAGEPVTETRVADEWIRRTYGLPADRELSDVDRAAARSLDHLANAPAPGGFAPPSRIDQVVAQAGARNRAGLRSDMPRSLLEVLIAAFQPSLGWPMTSWSGTNTLSRKISPNPVSPPSCSIGRTVTPGACRSNMT